jgi:NADPH:quinone reductase-like Zn-dependent oxidoreductase
MKQWVTNQDGLDKLRLVEVPEPQASDLIEGEVLVKIHSVSLNFRDTEGERASVRFPGLSYPSF